MVWKMKKLLPILILPIFLVTTLYLTPLYPVYAKDATSSTPRSLKNSEKLALIEASRDGKLQGIREKVASRAALLREKLATFRDRVKANRVQNINDILARINKVRTDAMLRHYDRMVEILTKVEDRVNEASGNGKDMTAAKSSISQARSALNEAKIALDAQIDKDYTVNVSSESTVKADAMAQRQQLFSDLKSIHDLLVTARKVIAEAISQAMSSIKGVSDNGQ